MPVTQLTKDRGPSELPVTDEFSKNIIVFVAFAFLRGLSGINRSNPFRHAIRRTCKQHQELALISWKLNSSAGECIIWDCSVEYECAGNGRERVWGGYIANPTVTP